ncbi:MAG: AMP-binding protein, partial [Geodermatophilaceae bacterium]|nr:AMP-binding protein [Geodermatophilaceae bacterium]
MDAPDFLAARDFLLSVGTDYDRAMAEFRWPQPAAFNWALDHVDALPAGDLGLWIVHEDGSEEKLTFGDLSRRSNQLANHLRGLGVGRGDPLLLMLGNVVPLWVTMLAATKLGAVIIPASTLLGPEELADRLDRGQVRAVVTAAALTDRFATLPGDYLRLVVDGAVEGWESYDDLSQQDIDHHPDRATRAGEPLFRYFTSGTTNRPKLVEHSHVSYPIGHLSTMFWIGVRPGDVHLNISSPGWGKHAWSSLFGPWNAGATVFVVNQARFDAPALLREMVRCRVSSFCAPPTVWRMLVQQDLAAYDMSLREVIGAGEPLNAEIIDQVRAAWGLTIRDGFGQTETTAMCGNSPGQPVKDGSMGRPLPGYAVVLLDPVTGEPAEEGEICLDLTERPLGLMVGYRDDAERTAEVMAGGYYRTGDVARRDPDGYITYVGRTDDVFKASDYRISPFELESVLIEHPAVAEAAVVPSPDPVRLAVPKAFVVLAPGHAPDAETAAVILGYCRGRLAAFKRIRRIEFAEL